MRALDTNCTYCGAQPGKKCHTTGPDEKELANVHKNRLHSARVITAYSSQEAVKALVEAAQYACVAMTMRHGHDGDVIEGCEDVEKKHGGAMSEAYSKLRMALAKAEQ